MGGLRRFGALAVALTLFGATAGCGDDDERQRRGPAEETTTTEGDSSEDEGSGDEDEDSSGDVDTGAVDFGNLEECLQFAGALRVARRSSSSAAPSAARAPRTIDVEEIIGRSRRSPTRPPTTSRTPSRRSSRPTKRCSRT